MKYPVHRLLIIIAACALAGGCRTAEQNPATTAPAAGSPRPGIFYVPIPDVKAYTVFTDESLFLHEAIPGRAADVAAGGEGAPLATMFHQMVFGRKGRHVCVNNLGGI